MSGMLLISGGAIEFGTAQDTSRHIPCHKEFSASQALWTPVEAT